MHKIDKAMNKIALPVIAVAGMLIIAYFTINTQSSINENNGYIRVINCILSSPSEERTQRYIESCYQNVEDALGLTLQRYDTSAYNQ